MWLVLSPYEEIDDAAQAYSNTSMLVTPISSETLNQSEDLYI